MKHLLFLIICIFPTQILAQNNRLPVGESTVNNPAALGREQNPPPYGCCYIGCNGGITGTSSLATFRKKEEPTMQKELKKRLTLSKFDRLKFEVPDTKLVKIFNKPCSLADPIDIAGNKCFVAPEIALGSFYSFAQKNFSSFSADIAITKHNFIASNIFSFQISIFADIGDVAIENIDNKMPEISDITKFWVGENEIQQAQTRKDLLSDILLNKMIVTTSRKVVTNHTYILRTVNFNSKFKPSSDKVFAFRVVDQKEDIVTIVWKEIKT